MIRSDRMKMGNQDFCFGFIASAKIKRQRAKAKQLIYSNTWPNLFKIN